jgi:hypothetical protein
VDIGLPDSLAINPDTGKAYIANMHVDECWYCGPLPDSLRVTAQ